jgi:hypothetical protein
MDLRFWLAQAGDLGGAATTTAKWGRADQKLNAVDGPLVTDPELNKLPDGIMC